VTWKARGNEERKERVFRKIVKREKNWKKVDVGNEQKRS
jgi:hypothetical protein